MEKRNCKICGKEFEPKVARQLTCSRECSKKLQLEINKANYWRKRGERICTCKICGKEFVPGRGGNQTCSKKCAKENQRRVKAEWVKRRTMRQQQKSAAIEAERNRRARAIFVPPKPGEIKLVPEEICHACYKEFEPRYPKEKFCSDECRCAFFKLEEWKVV